MPESRCDVSQGKHFSIANVCKKMIYGWYWILRALECSVQRSGSYAKSYSILSRRLVDDRGSTYPVGGLSYFFNNTLFLKIFDFRYKFVFNRQRDLPGSSFRWSNILFRVEVQFAIQFSYTVFKHLRVLALNGLQGQWCV